MGVVRVEERIETMASGFHLVLLSISGRVAASVCGTGKRKAAWPVPTPTVCPVEAR